MGKSSSVQPPDPAETAKAQGQANVDAALATAKLNQINQVTPWGTLSYSGDFPVQSSGSQQTVPAVPGGFVSNGRPVSVRRDPGGEGEYYVYNDTGARATGPVTQQEGSPAYTKVTSGGSTGRPRTATITLPEAVQNALNSQNRVTEGLSGYAEQFVPRALEGLSDPFSLNGLPAAPQASSEERQRIEAALMGRLEPYLQRDQQALDTRLANQGITQGSEAYRGGQDDLSRARNDARLATIGVAGDEYARSFGLETQARQNAINELLLGRTQPINEIAALLQGGPAIQSPSFNSPGQVGVAPADFIGAQGQNLQAQNANVASQNADSASRNALIGTAATAAAIF